MALFSAPNVEKLLNKRDIRGLGAALCYNGKDKDIIREEALGSLIEIGPDSVNAFIKALKNKDFNVRAEAAKALRLLCDVSAVDHLIPLLNDSKGICRRFAADALGAIKDTRALEPLFAAFMSSPVDIYHRIILYSYVEAICDLGDTGAISALRPYLSHEDWSIPYIILRNLWKFDKPEVIDILKEYIFNSNSTISNEAIGSLTKIDDPRVIDPLVFVLGQSDKKMLDDISKALIRFGEIAVEPLCKALTSNKISKAAPILGMIDDPRATETLIQVSENDDANVRRAAIKALGHKKLQKAKNIFIKALKDTNWGVRAEAVTALGMLKDLESVPELIVLFSEEDYSMNDKIIASLSEMGKDVVDPLLRNFANSKTYVQKGIIDTFILIKDNDTIPTLLNALGSNEKGIRQRAAEALGHFSDAIVVEALIKCLTNDPSPAARKYAAQSLGRIGDQKALQSLINALKDEGMLVRQFAVGALVKIKATDIIEYLVPLLKEENDIYSQIVAWALGEIGDKKGIEPLIESSRSSKKWIRIESLIALGKIGDVSALDILLNALDDPDKDVYKETALAIGRMGQNTCILPLIEALRKRPKGNNYAGDLAVTITALGEIGDSKAITFILSRIHSQNSNIQSAAIKALGSIGDQRCIPALKLILKCNNKELIALAKEAIDQINKSSV